MTKKQEYSLWEKIVAGMIGAIIVGLNIYLFNAKPCEGIDQIYLSCRFTGSFMDWVGAGIMDLAAIVWGYFTFNPTYANSPTGNIGRYPVVAIAIGLIIIYAL